MYLAGIMVFYTILGSFASTPGPSSPHARGIALSRQESSSSESAKPQDESKVPSQETPPSETKAAEPSQTPVGEPSNQQTPAAQGQQSTEKQQGENPQAGSEQAGPTPTSSTNKSTPPSANTHRRKRRPKKVVVHNGGTAEPTTVLAPGMTEEQASNRRQNINQLLVSTDDNLKRISGRQLNSSQQATLDQIRAYMQQAKSAADSGDLERGHNLATKAHLLADDLLKH